jgi:hypothetical protein
MTPYNLLGITGTPKIFTVDTTAPTTYAAAVGGGATSTSSAVKLQWYGSYSYVAISQSVNGGAYVDLSSVVVSTPYTVNDVSGNTSLSYKITPYYSGVAGTAASVITVNTNVQAPRDVSAVYLDASSIQVSFTVPKNTYSSSAVYTLRATNVSSGTYKDVSGTTSPLWIQNLSAGTAYSVVAKTTLDNSAGLVSSSSTLIVTTSYVAVTLIPIPTGATTYTDFTSGSKIVSGITGTYSYTNGTYTLTYSNQYADNNWQYYTMFNNSTAIGWLVDGYNSTTGAYTGSVSTTSSGSAIKGEYNQIKLPYSCTLKSYILTNIVFASISSFKTFAMVGSIDGITWYTIDTNTNSSTVGAQTTFNIPNNTSSYLYYRFIGTSNKINTNATYAGMKNLALIGTVNSPPTISNAYFLIPAQGSNSGTDITSNKSVCTGWTFSTTGSGFLICNGKPNNIYSGTLPLGVTQYIYIYGNKTSGTVSQSLTFAAGTYTLNFYAFPRDTYYTTTTYLTVSIGSIVLESGITFATGGVATPFYTSTKSFTISTSGSYTLTFSVVNPVVSDSTMCFSGIQIV